MAHLHVYKNKNADTRARIPFLLDIQSDHLDVLATRVVVPLHLLASLPYRPISRLMPELEIEGVRVVMLTPQLAGVAREELGARVMELSMKRSEVIAALDVLFTGV